MEDAPPRILAAAAAYPENRYGQAEIRECLAARWNGSARALDPKLLDRAGVRFRHLAFPLDYYFAGHGFARRNRDWSEVGLDLGRRALAGALDRAGVEPAAVGHLLFVTTTGLATPSLDALLSEAMGLPRGMLRSPLFGVGCAGGAVGLARAADWLSRRPESVAVVLSVELCGQTFLSGDRSKTNLVGTALFGDGAAAVVLAGANRAAGRAGVDVLFTESELFPGSRDLMGWDFTDEGFRLLLSPEVPAAVDTRVAPALVSMLERAGLPADAVRHWVLHPGGPRVLGAFQQRLGVAEDAFRWTTGVLAERGNLSSATVLAALADFLAAPAPPAGEPFVLAAMGPGFALEVVAGRTAGTPPAGGGR